MRHAAFLLALLASAPAAAKPPQPGQFLDKSIVTLPGSTGDYRLADLRYEPERWMQGVFSQWVVNAAPRELRLTLFVHPMGRTPEQNAIAIQTAEIEHFMGEAVKQGLYTDLVVGESEPFVVVARGPSLLGRHSEAGAAIPEPEPAIAADAGSGALAAALPSPNTHGQRLSFAFAEKGVPMRSFDYVFYRHLFAFKLRVAAPVDSMDEMMFAALADTAARKLVPRVEVRNYGQCGNPALPAAGAHGKTDAKASGQQQFLAMARIRADNCAVEDDAKPADETHGERRVEIVYPPDTWRADG
jgi:hypothetical protein